MPATTAPPVVLDDGLWQRVTQITGGATAACFQCGVCTASCPWNLVRGQPVNIRELVRRTQLGVDGVDGAADPLWLCTTCGQCTVLCPRGVDVPQVIRSLRGEAWRAAEEPELLSGVLWNVHQDGNPWGQPPSTRDAWAAGLGIEPFDAAVHDVLLYVGCSAAYDRRLQRVAHALVTVLRAAGVRFGTLGEEEPCCGEAVLSLGNDAYFAEVAERNAHQLEAAGVTTLVALSPHCVEAFTRHEGVGADFRPLHYTQYLAGLLAEGGLPPLAVAEEIVVTYHDPCLLGRGQAVYEQPRALLAAIEGVDLREMDNNREQALCCGGGGGRLWFDTTRDERFAPLRVTEARDTGAAVLATACPACLSCLADGVTTTGAPLAVMDVVEVMARAVKGAPA
jgi:Fe-S oxidoreductase